MTQIIGHDWKKEHRTDFVALCGDVFWSQTIHLGFVWGHEHVWKGEGNSVLWPAFMGNRWWFTCLFLTNQNVLSQIRPGWLDITLYDPRLLGRWRKTMKMGHGTSININCFGVETGVCIIKMEYLGQIPPVLEGNAIQRISGVKIQWSVVEPTISNK